MDSRSWRVVISVLCTAVAAVAQVAPFGLTSVEGSGTSPHLFGGATPVRLMDIYNQAVLPPGFDQPRSIRGITLRADTYNNTVRFAPKRGIALQVFISTSFATAESTELSFEAMHGVDRTLVVDGWLDIPEQPVPTTPAAPRPFNIPMPFDQPWVFQLSPARRGPQLPDNLVVDYKIYNKRSSDAYYLDSAGFCKANKTPFGLGAQCRGTSGKPITLQTNDDAYASNRLLFAVRDAIPTNTVTLALSMRPLGGFIPVEIDQGSGCYINFAPIVAIPLPADSTGSAVFRFPLPRDGRIVGLDVHAQAAAFDFNANRALHVTSFGLTTTICGPDPVAQMIELSSGPNGGPNATKAQSNVYGLAHVIAFQ